LRSDSLLEKASEMLATAVDYMIGTKHESEKWIHAFDLVDGTLK
jgi:hypothetical protein